MHFTRSIFAKIWILTGLLFVLPACDIVDPPYMTGQEGPGNGQDNGELVQKILLEEFTGHQCPNCPEGSAIAQELKDFYGDRLVIMSIHAGWFARVSPGTFEYDFQTPEGDALNDFFGVVQNPIGMVNRSMVGGSRLMGPSAWGEVVSQLVEQEPASRIQLDIAYDPGSRQLELEVEVDALLPSEGPHHLSVFLTESHIIKPQRTNHPDHPSGVIEDYNHKYVLRTALNGTFGEQLCQGPVSPGDSFSRTYALVLDEEWVADHCSLVVFVYDGDSMEIIQVEEAALLP